jgi:hypothetical protein
MPTSTMTIDLILVYATIAPTMKTSGITHPSNVRDQRYTMPSHGGRRPMIRHANTTASELIHTIGTTIAKAKTIKASGHISLVHRAVTPVYTKSAR